MLVKVPGTDRFVNPNHVACVETELVGDRPITVVRLAGIAGRQAVIVATDAPIDEVVAALNHNDQPSF